MEDQSLLKVRLKQSRKPILGFSWICSEISFTLQWLSKIYQLIFDLRIVLLIEVPHVVGKYGIFK